MIKIAAIVLFCVTVFLCRVMAQSPVIVSKPNIVIPLNASGIQSILPSDVVTIMDTLTGNNTVNINPATVSCANTGSQKVIVTATNYQPNPSAVSFANPVAIASDSAGNLAVSDIYYSYMRYLSTTGLVTPIDSNATNPYSKPGNYGIVFPEALTFDSQGNLYVVEADDAESGIYKITPSGVLSTIIVGYNTTGKSTDGPVSTATTLNVENIAVDKQGNIFFTELGNKVREISTAGMVTTIAGSVNGYGGFQNGTGMNALFNNPSGIAIDSHGNIFVSDRGNFAIRKITPQGVVTTFAGGTFGFTNGTGTAAQFSTVYSIAIDNQDNIYVGDDFTNAAIRKITPAAVVTTFAGTGTVGDNNGPGATATFSDPISLAVDAHGDVFVDDRGNLAIRKITPQGIVSTYAGSGKPGDSTGNIFLQAGAPAVDTVTVTIKSSLAITSMFSNTSLAINTNCPTLLPDYTKNATASDNCSNKITFTQTPAPGTAIVNTAPIAVTITATDSLKQQVSTSFTVTPNNTPVAAPALTISTAQTTVCDSTPITFKASPSNGGSHPVYQWQLNGVPVGADSLNYTTNSLKNQDIITCLMTSTSGCLSNTLSNSIVMTVQPNFTPEITINTAADTLCQGDNVSFTASTTNAGSNPSFQWEVNGVVTGNIGPAFNTSQLADKDQVTCAVTNNDPSCLTTRTAISLPIVIHVNPILTPTVLISSSATGPVCAGTLVTFTASAINATETDYQWLVNGAAIGPDNAIFNTSSLTNGSVVSCNITCKGKCLSALSASSNTLNMSITPLSPLTVTISPADTSACAGTPVTFTAKTNIPQINLLYQWNVNGVTKGNNSPAFTSSSFNDGDEVTCSVSSGATTCVTPITSAPSTLHIYPLPEASFFTPLTIKQGENVMLSPIIKGNVKTYQWSPVAGLSNPDIANPMANPNQTTTYTLELTSVAGCQDTAKVTVTVLPALNIPNTFTPNGDGINDIWDIPSLAYYHNCQVKVFNRYGQLVFHSTGYGQPWDGKYNGTQLNSGTYYYIIDLHNSMPVYAGYVAIIR